MRSLGDLLRLLLLFLLLPLLLFLLGPFLVVSALWGRASFFGALQFEPGKHHRRGRDWAFSVGVLAWVLTWGGLAVFWPGSPILPVLRAGQTATAPAVAVTIPTPAATATSTALPRLTATPLPPTVAPSATPSPENPPAPIATATVTTVTATVTPTNTPVTPTNTPAPVTVSPTVTAEVELSTQQVTEVLQSLTKANNLLVAVLNGSAPGGSADLDGMWQDAATAEVKNFVRNINAKYHLPVQVSYKTVGIPQIKAGGPQTVYVTSREEWAYQGAGAERKATNDYNYTFQRKKNGWVITSYQFNAVSLPAE